MVESTSGNMLPLLLRIACSERLGTRAYTAGFDYIRLKPGRACDFLDVALGEQSADELRQVTLLHPPLKLASYSGLVWAIHRFKLTWVWLVWTPTRAA